MNSRPIIPTLPGDPTVIDGGALAIMLEEMGARVAQERLVTHIHLPEDDEQAGRIWSLLSQSHGSNIPLECFVLHLGDLALAWSSSAGAWLRLPEGTPALIGLVPGDGARQVIEDERLAALARRRGGISRSAGCGRTLGGYEHFRRLHPPPRHRRPLLTADTARRADAALFHGLVQSLTRLTTLLLGLEPIVPPPPLSPPAMTRTAGVLFFSRSLHVSPLPDGRGAREVFELES